MKYIKTAFVLLFFLLPLLTKAQYSESNQVLRLDGAGFISIPNNFDLNYSLTTTGKVSIDAWVYPTESGSQMTIVGNNLYNGYWFGITSTRKLRFNPNSAMYQESNATIALNSWTHVAVSYNSRLSTMKFFVNGALDRTITTPQSYIETALSDFRIGADRAVGSSHTPALFWKGMIDEVRVWDDAIDFSTGHGLLYRIPHGMVNGFYGRKLKGGWRLNGNAVSVGGTVNGTTVGTATYLADPDPPHYTRIGVFFENDPYHDDRITIPHQPALAITQNYTLECWVRPAIIGPTQFQTFICKGLLRNQAIQFWFGLNKFNGCVRFVPDNDWANALESSAPIPLNVWSHVAARFQQTVTGGRLATLFVNGLEVSSKSYASSGVSVSDPMFFGSSDTTVGSDIAYGFSGTLDEVRIWNTARTNADIANHYNMELDGPLPGLLASYHFNGDDLDASGNALHGTGMFPISSANYFYDVSSLPAIATLKLLEPTGGENWMAGVQHQIRWSSIGINNVAIELSRDGGLNFNEILAASVPASSGQFDWTVTGPETDEAVIRIRQSSSTLPTDQSAKFTIAVSNPIISVSPQQIVFTANAGGPIPVTQQLYITNTGGSDLQWTASTTQGVWLKVDPDSGSSNDDSTIVMVTTTNLPIGQYSDRITLKGNAINDDASVVVIYNIVPVVLYSISGFVRSASGAGIEGVLVSIIGTESRTTLTGPHGEYSFVGLPPGDYFVEPISNYYDFTPPMRSYLALSTDYTDAHFEAHVQSGNVVIRYDAGWNLISLPMNSSGIATATLFPHASSAAYEYIPEVGYVEATTLEFGKGYWIKFSAKDSVSVNGIFTPNLTLNLSSEYGGWSLIGAPSGPVLISNISQSPAGALVSVYGYNPDIGYIIPVNGIIHPGRGYFIKINTDAVLKLISSILAAPFYQPEW